MNAHKIRRIKTTKPLAASRSVAKDLDGIRPIVFALCAVFTATFVGCSDSGPELGTVAGTVLLDGQPVADAEVVFEPEEGSPSYGMTDAQGRYRLMYTPETAGAVVGQHTVRITTGRTAGGPGEEVQIPERIPASYNSQSEVQREVKPGSNTIDFDIQSSE